CALGEAAPKPKASAKKKKGDSAFSTTPPTPTPTTTVESALRLSAAAKGKQPSRATTSVEPTDIQRTEAEQLKLVLKRSRHETHISQQKEEGSFDPIPRTLKDSEKESDDEEEQESRLSEEARIQEDEDADELYRDVNINQGRGLQVTQNVEDTHVILTLVSRLSEEARIQEEEDTEELYRDVNINQGRGLQVTQNVEDTHVILTPVNHDGPQESSSMSSFVSSMLNPISDVGVESIFTTTSSQIVSLEPPTPIMTPSTITTITTSGEAPIPPPTIPSIILENLPTFNSAFRFEEILRTSYAIAADLSEMEL
nr:hypothetical protein [Tanacetum cinerariifolium]